MLQKYDLSYKQTTNQILLINNTGIIIDAESVLFKNCIGKHIENINPLFNTITPLLSHKNKTYNFECINIEIENLNYTIDASLHIKNPKEPSVFIFQELTKQYIIYKKAAQKRNVNEIKSQVLDYNNTILQEKEAFKNAFIANFSHEIEMPVSTINESISLLENTSLEQKQYYNLNVIKNTNDKLKTMINDIIDISKIETGHFTVFPMRYNLQEELNLIIEIFSQKCKEKGLTLNFSFDNKCPKYVISDKYRLVQIINNLIGNAIKFTQKGRIDLKTKFIAKNHDVTTIQFNIEDTGIGIDNKKTESIFKDFYQINNHVVNNGSGLGLAITKKLVEALNGKIEVISNLNQGSTFSVTLDFKITKNQKEDNIITKTTSNNIKILLAEPLQSSQTELIKILSKIENSDVVVVDNGDKVIEALYKSTFNVVILNIKLPAMDGLETTRYIRSSHFKQINKTPIIIVSDNPSKEEESYCKKKEINSYFGKPFNQAVIKRKVKYLLQKSKLNNLLSIF